MKVQLIVENMNSSNDSSFDTEVCDPPDVMKKLFVCLHIVVIIIGFPSNCFSVFVSYQHIRQGNELGVYLMNLALADLFFIMTLPIWMDYSLKEHWQHGGTACTVCVILMFTHFYASVSLLCGIAVDRYLAVVHPLRYPFVRKRGPATGICILSWTCSAIFNATTVSTPMVFAEEHNQCLDTFPIPEMQRHVNIARFFVWFLLPSALVGFCYWKISQEVRSNRATEEQERQRVCRLLRLVQLTLLLCFGPIHIMLLLRALLEDCQTQPWLYYPYKVSAALATLNCLADPLLYCFITRSGRASVSKAFLFLQRKSNGTHSERELAAVSQP
ncbi:G-protein coupled receptor 4-like [Sardina pilchardus]|uniref:G-protein coupled receptor 4-like n=1 Tax=Sardina pilchardus TaxID=27697 RepID=UPI002E10700E